jgi:hypothetical protein
MPLKRVPAKMNSDVPLKENDSATIYSVVDFLSQSKRLPRSPFTFKWSVVAVGPTPTPTQLFLSWTHAMIVNGIIHVSDLTRAENFQ